jgi:hypothetical protein
VQPMMKISRAWSSSALWRFSGWRSDAVMVLGLLVVLGLWCRFRLLHRLAADSWDHPSSPGLGMGIGNFRHNRSLQVAER